MKRKLFVIALSLLTMRICFAQVQPDFVATISFGIQVPVYVHDGKSPAYDFAYRTLHNNENQGILILLGRDKHRLWYIQAGYSNDAAEESWFMNLAYTDSAGHSKIFLTEVDEGDTTFTMRFRTAFEKHFKRNKLEQLIPVEAWAPPTPYFFIAQVNCKELNRCFEFDFIVDSEDNGSCVFYFEWNVHTQPFQQTRKVSFSNCMITIPYNWTFSPGDERHGYVEHGGDTLHYYRRTAIRMLPIEMIELKYSSTEDSILFASSNNRARAYNDSLRKANPMMLTHAEKTIYKGDTTTHLIYPKPGISGSILMNVFVHGEAFVFSTTELKPEEQPAFREIMESWELP